MGTTTRNGEVIIDESGRHFALGNLLAGIRPDHAVNLQQMIDYVQGKIVGNTTFGTTAGTATQGNDKRISTVINIKMYGAVGDYNPVTGVGTDDTNAIKAAIAASSISDVILIPSPGIYKITDTIKTKTGTTLIGEGDLSIIWADLVDKSKPAIQLSAYTSTTGSDRIFRGSATKFCIYGDTNPCAYALKAYFIDFANIDVKVRGAFSFSFNMDTDEPYGTISASGVQNSLIKITSKQPNGSNWPYSKSLPASGGVYQKGYVNASFVFVDFQSVQENTNGGIVGSKHGIHLLGNYGAANSCTISGTIQGASGRGMVLEKCGGGTVVRDFYCEANEENSLIKDSNNIKVEGRSQENYEIENSRYVDIDSCYSVDIDALSYHVYIGKTIADSVQPITSLTDAASALFYAKFNLVSDTRSKTLKSLYDFRNYLINGDFCRFLSASGTNRVWGWNDTYSVIEKCGVGQSDTTHTYDSDFCAKISRRVGQGSMFKQTIKIPLDGKLNSVISIFFKYKIISGNCSFQVCASNAGDSYQITLSGNDIEVEDGFEIIRYNFLITQEFIDNGLDLRFHVPNIDLVESSMYISEVYVGFGVGNPHNFIPYNSNKFKLNNGLMVLSGTGIPSAGDPLFNQNFIPGDTVSNVAPVAGGFIGWVCVTAGSPGTWKEFGAIES